MIEQESEMSKDVFFVGIDVGSKEVWASIAEHKPKRFVHSAAGIKELQHWVEKHSAGTPPHFCLEGTGVYSLSVASHLFRHEQTQISIVNPAQINNHAKSQLLRCKSDQLDAATIRSFAESAEKLPLWRPGSKTQIHLHQLVQLREQIESEIRQWKNRCHSREYLSEVHKLVKQTQDKILRSLNRQLERVEMEIQALATGDAETAQQIALLSTIAGFAQKSATQLLGSCPNSLLDRGNRSLIAHAGLSPHPEQSGTARRGGSVDKRGNRRIRKALYMPTLVAIQHNPVIRNFYQRLIQRGKPKMVALVAAMKKLLMIAYAVLRDKKPFNPKTNPLI